MHENDTPHSLTTARRLPRSVGRPRSGLESAARPLLLLAGFSAATLAVEPDARALQGGEDASTLPVLIDKKYGLAGRLQLGAMFSTTLATKFTESTGGTLNVQYNFIDQLGLELTGGFYSSSEAQILEEIRTQLGAGVDPQVSDMHQMQWLAALNLMWVPIYGKISFASEWNPSFDFYVLAGGGVVGTKRGISSATSILPDSSETDIAPMANFGGGLRIFVMPMFAIRLDVRNYFYADPDAGEQTFTGDDPTNQDDDGTISGLTQALVGQVGVQVNFGGDQ